jgi:hypothetical protein
MELLAFFIFGVIMLGVFIPVAMIFLAIFTFMIIFSAALWLVSVGAIPLVVMFAVSLFIWARM